MRNSAARRDDIVISSFIVLPRESEALIREQACIENKALLYGRRRPPNFKFKLGVVGGIEAVLRRKDI
jgi:hypothetical protein